MRNSKLLFLLVTVVVFLMIIIDHSGLFSYWGRSIIKISMFGLVPGLFLTLTKSWTPVLAKGKHLSHILLFGFSIFVIVVVGYFLISQFISFDQVPDSLKNQVGVSLDNYLWVSIYIVLINGPLEEFFFRYFIMLNTWFKNRLVLIIVSSFLFAIYHVGMLFTMFDFYVFVFAILGLMVVGMFFIWLNHQNKGILYSILIHMFANAGINLVGYIILIGAR
jgi:uncharacterized protein